MTAAPSAPDRPCTLLICDDKPQLRQALHDVLTQHPRLAVVGQADDGASCLAQLRSSAPDVLILDVNMPGGGPGLARAIKQIDPATYVLVYSARRDAQTRTAMLDAGADDYLVKTGRLRPLLDLLVRVCEVRCAGMTHDPDPG